MSNFEDIKVGDMVLFSHKISSGFFDRSKKTFMVGHSVERVTKTLFIVHGKQFYKKGGRERTSSHSGLQCVHYSKENDQRKEMEAYIKLLNTRFDAGKKLEMVTSNINQLNQSDLDDLISKIEFYAGA